MKERPILFNSEMVRAVLYGRKTQTRRVIKNITPDCRWRVGKIGRITCPHPKRGKWGVFVHLDEDTNTPLCDLIPCPYGGIGDKLWVRESFFAHRGGGALVGGGYIETVEPSISYKADGYKIGAPWKPSIHMPRWASRITLEVLKVRVERVQDISEEDAKAGGVEPMELDEQPAWLPMDMQLDRALHHKMSFIKLWGDINAKRGYGWDVNPWVWVVEFKVDKIARRGRKGV